MSRPSFKIPKSDAALIAKIVRRAESLLTPDIEINPTELAMDLTACHANGCPMDFARLLEAPDADFIHDVLGIRKHINRKTGNLQDCFVPRCALPEPT